MKQGKFIKYIYPRRKGILVKLINHKINHILPTSKFTYGILQIKVNSLSTSFNINFDLTQRLDVCRVGVFDSM